MVEAQPAEPRRAVADSARSFGRRRAEFARFAAARLGAGLVAGPDPPVEARAALFPIIPAVRHAAPAFAVKTLYMGAMSQPATAPTGVAAAIHARLVAELSPTRLSVSNDSAQHAGHMGDDGTGESHFSVTIESPAFTGQSRVARQRLVNQALAELLSSRIHALAIRATAPGET